MTKIHDDDVMFFHYQRRAWHRLLGPTSPRLVESRWQPAANVYELDGAVLLHVEAPGLRPDDIRLVVQDDRCTVSGVRRAAVPSAAVRCHRVEMASGPFRVVIPLPWPVDPDAARVEYEAGIISVLLPQRS